ncbi:MAG: hypothetical protein JRE45_14260 [Deltaproteobacteria bacterium]|nr:hypothetical protein [Deltaproteobacteria bacterium]MBW2213908.1 hypothetical protein [Deltaproteobacteria bacterium]MBW2379352.1 hypothetical protein [Deltaproteobacteria bacterium]MBW2628776.1 hypothetical protein [Deltaproteobacteria bacterium]MBW2686076.1 hypothetical protein [Deltaproteobacteria bacterium]
MKRLFLLVMACVTLAGCGDSSAVGGSCTTAEDCGAGLCIVSGSFPDGLCTPACDVDDECPEGFSCISRSGGICLLNCTGTQECEELRGDAWQCREESLQQGGGNRLVCIGD